ncbi:MAG: hypothetical protein GY778_22920 [bacterium]|nr:hypothetical protein [bacterium]
MFRPLDEAKRSRCIWRLAAVVAVVAVCGPQIASAAPRMVLCEEFTATW